MGEMALIMFVAPLTWHMLARVMRPTAPNPNRFLPATFLAKGNLRKRSKRLQLGYPNTASF
jgi:hypothetical protein